MNEIAETHDLYQPNHQLHRMLYMYQIHTVVMNNVIYFEKQLCFV